MTRVGRWPWGVGRIRVVAIGLVVAVFAGAPRASQAQADQSLKLRAQQDTLERIRREREDLERRAAELQVTVHDLNEEVTNLDRRADATARIVKTLDAQLETITQEVAATSGKVTSAEDELAAKRTALRRRLIEIYKRGPLYTSEAMLSAHSFGELVARYKYLHLLALHDRALVARVEQLRDQVRVEHDRLVSLQLAIEENRSDKQQEAERLRDLEHDREVSLDRTKAQAKMAEDRLSRLKTTETQLTNAIGVLEAERRRVETARPNAPRATSTIATTDYGHLDWPVDGPLVYTFGKAQTASNTTIRWNGVGIRAMVGTNVRAVSAGKVVSVRQLGTYGLTVIIDHGGGDYSIYGSLSRADVNEQQVVAKDQVIGAVGISDPDLPPHLHFEIRHGGPAVDPATWLRDQQH
ncbi:MAG TPA: peptidoglycan DD-metalloendopeptidase family protein [Gemmatimonadaceae bacterium]|nr:peptidoglycan DD-metalloendopeptidase family protein [Gemmatimonadaceae bacterium]